MNGVKSDSKDAQTPKTDASDPTAKLPVAGKDHEGEPKKGSAYTPGPMGNDPRMTEPKVGPTKNKR